MAADKLKSIVRRIIALNETQEGGQWGLTDQGEVLFNSIVVLRPKNFEELDATIKRIEFLHEADENNLGLIFASV
jgi:hypothetical protein